MGKILGIVVGLGGGMGVLLLGRDSLGDMTVPVACIVAGLAMVGLWNA